MLIVFQTYNKMFIWCCFPGIQRDVYLMLFSRHTTSYLPSLLRRSLAACWPRLSWPTLRSYRPSTCSTTECLFSTIPRPQSRSVFHCNQKEIIYLINFFTIFQPIILICLVLAVLITQRSSNSIPFKIELLIDWLNHIIERFGIWSFNLNDTN